MRDLKMAEKPDEAVKTTGEPNIAEPLNVNKKAAGSATSSNDKVEYLKPPVKPDCDDDVHRVLKLRNGLTVLLAAKSRDKQVGEFRIFKGFPGDTENLSDMFEKMMEQAMLSTSSIFVCTLSIDVGCFSDSAENPGIAELLSKVILAASKKYPTPYSFAQFLRKQHGDVLAYCDKERTLFTFSGQVNLGEALRRFANFFIEPLLKPEVVEIERKLDSDAVLIEEAVSHKLPDPALIHAKNYLFGMLASKCENNPASHLPGRNKVLHSQSSDTLLKKIEKFMKRHYSAHRMIVSLKSYKLSLDELEEHAKTYFSQIPSNGLPPIDFTRFSFDKCFDSPEFRMIYELQASCEKLDHHLELHWPMPSRTTLYKSKPTEYLSWVLQQDGKGSLIRYLSQKNWCTDLSCATENTCLEPNSIFSLFSLNLSVTDEGQRNGKKILDAVYSYINLLKIEGPQRKIYEEIREKLDRQFQRNDQVLRCLCNKHSSLLTMHNRTSADFLNGSIVLSEYDPAAIKQCLELLSPENANIIVCQKKYGSRYSLSETWEEVHDRAENVKYRRSMIPEAWINRWKNVEPLPGFKLPLVDYDATILEDPYKYPVKIRSDDLCEVHLLDTESFNNRITVDYLYCTPGPRESAENSFMLDAFAYLLGRGTNTALMHLNYHDSHVTFTSHGSGLYQLITGPDNHTTLRSIETIAIYGADLANYTAKCVPDDVFTEVKAQLAAEYLGPLCSSEALASDVLIRVSSPGHWLFYEKYDASLGVNLKKFKHFALHFFDHVFVKCLAQGNVTEPEVIENVQRCFRALNCRPLLKESQIPHNLVYKLLPGSRCCRFQSTSIDDVTTIMNHYQFSERPTVKQSAIISFLGVTMKAPELKSLRARQNLDDYEVTMEPNGARYGYTLHRSLHYTLRTKKSQSGNFTRVATIEASIEKFREAMHKWFKSLTTTEWETVKTVFKRTMDSSNSTARQILLSNWGEIQSGAYAFNRLVRDTKLVIELPIEDLRRSVMYLTSNDSSIRKLSVQAISRREYAEGTADARQTQSPRRLHFLTNLPGEEAKPDDYYITDIAAYTRGLTTYPLLEDHTTS